MSRKSTGTRMPPDRYAEKRKIEKEIKKTPRGWKKAEWRRTVKDVKHKISESAGLQTLRDIEHAIIDRIREKK